MRRALERLYSLSNLLALIFVVLICVIVLVQVGFNLLDKIAEMVFGEAIGLVLPSYAEFAGYFLAASMSFALADALRHGAHIRVTLVTRKMSDQQRNLAEFFSFVVGLGLSGFFAFWAINLAYESYHFGDLSPGIIPVPLWIPQSTMAFGVLVLTICFLDQLILWFQRPAETVEKGG